MNDTMNNILFCFKLNRYYHVQEWYAFIRLSHSSWSKAQASDRWIGRECQHFDWSLRYRGYCICIFHTHAHSDEAGVSSLMLAHLRGLRVCGRIGDEMRQLLVVRTCRGVVTRSKN